MTSNVVAGLEAAFRNAASEDVVSAYLFGSHADDRAHRESDIDVGVLEIARIEGA
jgi:predicted nucleotidyltransferase